MVVNVGVQLGSCAVLKLGVDRNVGLDNEGLVLVMYIGVGLVLVCFGEENRCCCG